ncbi:BTAD domain-containing putative transcriptional regulator [Actinosynnema sp. NPDC050801]|uniref:BTAD domain-containing putative transcriptional regulator n=1 Tax=unclassified Actinosynnema TaxID=2637065 RepID=UPI0033F0C132
MFPDTFDIRLLGPVEVIGPGGPVALGKPRQRTLLGLLALRARHVVSRSALIDALWDEQPPGSAVKTLNAHVAHLRRALGTAGLRSLIGTRSPGYLLDVPVEHVDVHRFDTLLRSGRTAPSAEEAAQALRAALELWRGDVLADCAVGEWARAEVARLREARQYAVEELCGAELALGGHARVAVELEPLVARYPLRERLWELLMLALYRGGRQADALAAYHRARTTLLTELGVEPGPALRRLEAAILAGREPRTPWERTRHAFVPASVPAPLTSLIGRDKDVAELTSLVAERRLVTLTGVGGCGKTRLAIAVAGSVAHGFVDLTAVSEPGLVPRAVCDALGVRGDPDVTALAERLRDRELLLVLDNCEHLVDACAGLVEGLLRSCPRLRVLATSRESLALVGEVVWPVAPLPVPTRAAVTLAEARDFDAVRLFLDRAALPAVRELTDADAPALAAICLGLDGLPLALELAAARTAVLTVREIADRLRDPALLRAHRHPDRPHHRALDDTLAWSYDLLDPAGRSRFRRLAVFASGFDRAAVEAVWPETAGRAVDVLSDLVAKSLVMVDRRRGRARYRLPATIRHHAWERLAGEGSEEAETRRRHAEHYLALAVEADRQSRGADSAVWLDRLAVDDDNLRAASGHLAGTPGELRMALALARYRRSRGRYREGRSSLLEALRRCPDAPAGERARALSSVAFLSYFEGSYGVAADFARRALSAHGELADRQGMAQCRRLLGSIACERGEYRASMAWYAEALATYESADDESGRTDVVQMTGFASWLAGDLAGAKPLLERALRDYGALGDAENVSSTRVHLAAVSLYSGDLTRARVLAGQALSHFVELDFREGIAWTHNILGLIALREGGDAVPALRAGLRVHYEVGDRWRQASVLEALAAAHVDRPVHAYRLLWLATTIREELGVPVPAQERAWLRQTQETLSRRLSSAERYAVSLETGLSVADVLAEPAGPDGLDRSVQR